MNKNNQDLRKDQAILEHLVNKYGKDDVLHYINEGKFGDFVKKAAQKIKHTFKKVGDSLVAIFNGKEVDATSPVTIAADYANEKLPLCVSVIPSDNVIATAAEYGISLDKASAKEDIIASNKDDIKELNAYWHALKKFVEEKGVLSEGYQRRYNRRAGKLFEYNHPQAVPVGGYVDLRASADSLVTDVDTEEFMNAIRSSVGARLNGPAEGGRGKVSSLVPMVWGAPGIGKTQIVEQLIEDLSEEYGTHMELIYVTLAMKNYDDFSLNVPNVDHTKLIELALDWLPVYTITGDKEQDAIGNDVANHSHDSEGGGIIFLDEFSRANRGVMNVLMQLMDARKIGCSKLGSKWTLVCAGNRSEDVGDMQIEWENAYGRRLKQFNFVPSFEAWLKWARDNGIDEDIIDFLEQNPDCWYLGTNTGGENKTAGPNPASWDKLSQEWEQLRYYKFGNGKSFSKQTPEAQLDKKMDLYYQVMGRDTIPGDSDVLGWNARTAKMSKTEGNVGHRFEEFMNVFKYLPQDQCEKVWTDGDSVPIKFEENMGVIRCIIKALTKAKPNPEKMPTPDELENFMKFIDKFKNGSLRTSAFKALCKYYTDRGDMFYPSATGVRDSNRKATPEEIKAAMDPKSPTYNPYLAKIRPYLQRLGRTDQ